MLHPCQEALGGVQVDECAPTCVHNRMGFLGASRHPRWQEISWPHKKYHSTLSPKIKAVMRSNKYPALKWYLLSQEETSNKMFCDKRRYLQSERNTYNFTINIKWGFAVMGEYLAEIPGWHKTQHFIALDIDYECIGTTESQDILNLSGPWMMDVFGSSLVGCLNN